MPGLRYPLDEVLTSLISIVGREPFRDDDLQVWVAWAWKAAPFRNPVEHVGCIEVYRERSVRPLCCPVDGDSTVDILARLGDEDSALGPTEQLYEFGLEFLLCFDRLVRSEIRALAQEYVDVCWWLRHHPVDARGLAAMAPEVARIEDPLPGPFDQQHVGIESGVVHKYRSDGKRAEDEWSCAASPCFEFAPNRITCDIADNRDQLRRFGPRPDGPGTGKLMDEAPVVLVRMADKNGGRATPIERYRQKSGCALGGIQRTAGIDEQAVTLRMHDFDATAADLPCAAMNCNGEAHGPRRGRGDHPAHRLARECSARSARSRRGLQGGRGRNHGHGQAGVRGEGKGQDGKENLSETAVQSRR